MISFPQLSVLLVLFLVYKTCITLAVPRELKHVPAISLIAILASMLKGESFELRFERLLRPILEKTGVARVWNQGGWELVVGDAKQTKEILAKVDVYLKRREEDINLKIMLARRTMGFSNIVSSDGGEWRRHRRIANPAFKKSWSTDMFGSCAQSMIDLIRAADGAPLRVDGLFQRLTLDVLGKGMFSYDFEAISRGTDNHYIRLYNDIMKAMFDPIYLLFPFLENWVPWRQVCHQKGQEFRNFLRGIIRGRKAELTDSHDDLLSLMTKASVDEKNANLSEDEVIDDLSIFFLAGHDTTANTLTTIFYYLSKHPEIQEEARNEVNAVLNGERRVPTAEELKSLTYIGWVSKRVCAS
ncbi:hypothetical protein DSO57_1029735 [Entomophthora muscae]|uniref:Uncharacterized protein n=1 Tax=Entomophthora muscae TaxID=34485 RepID=A0ACC2TZC2_9FUNG|nr:hypothetical protein DSO57_1029735 [Entomophthora muscae]